MGEYAKYNRHEIKIGTCENMYYLRFKQRGLVTPMDGSVNPHSDKDCLHIRFRFPFPDEDAIEPGGFDEYDRSIPIPGNYPMPDGVNHYAIYTWNEATRRNDRSDCQSQSVRLIQQKLLADGRVVPVLSCGGCGALWRVEDEQEINEIAQAFIADGSELSVEVGARILRDAKVPVAV